MTELMPIKERLPILAALRKAVNKAYDEARQEMAAEMDAGDRKTLFVDGEKVGSASYAEGSYKTAIYNQKALHDFCIEHDIPIEVKIPSYVYSEDGDLFIDGENLVTSDGEVVPGIAIGRTDGSVKVTGCEPDDVMPRLASEKFLQALDDWRERRLHD